MLRDGLRERWNPARYPAFALTRLRVNASSGRAGSRSRIPIVRGLAWIPSTQAQRSAVVAHPPTPLLVSRSSERRLRRGGAVGDRYLLPVCRQPASIVAQVFRPKLPRRKADPSGDEGNRTPRYLHAMQVPISSRAPSPYPLPNACTSHPTLIQGAGGVVCLRVVGGPAVLSGRGRAVFDPAKRCNCTGRNRTYA